LKLFAGNAFLVNNISPRAAGTPVNFKRFCKGNLLAILFEELILLLILYLERVFSSCYLFFDLGKQYAKVTRIKICNIFDISVLNKKHNIL